MGKKGGKVRIKQMGSKAPKGMVNPMEDLMIPPEEMINLPPPPDRAYQIFWPIHETFSMDPSNFQCIYPSYLDSTKTVSKGRRIASEKAVPVPTVSDISQALQSLNIRHVLQPHKGYSRDIESLWDNPGRIMYEPDDVYTKRELIVEVASKVEALPSRIQRLEQEKIQAEIEKKNAEEATQRERQAKKQQKQLQQQSSKSSKKKGKKRR